MKTLFSHQRHKKVIKELKVTCQDCHRFTVGKQKIDTKKSKHRTLLHSTRKVCHRCHMEKISTPRRNQCTLCHSHINDLQPNDHFHNWKKRHGKVAQIDFDSCSQCHKRSECSQCHLRRDNMNPKVHEGNFKLTHSIKARANPHSCITCHRSKAFCYECHTGKRR